MEPGDREANERLLELGKLANLKELAAHIASRTYGGREPGQEPWQITREYMSDYEDPANADRLIGLLESAGCKDDIEAALWLP